MRSHEITDQIRVDRIIFGPAQIERVAVRLGCQWIDGHQLQKVVRRQGVHQRTSRLLQSNADHPFRVSLPKLSDPLMNRLRIAFENPPVLDPLTALHGISVLRI